MSTLLDKIKNVNESASKESSGQAYKRGVIVYNDKMKKTFYVELTSTPDKVYMQPDNSNLVIEVFDTNLDKIHNHLYNEDRESATMIDCTYNAGLTIVGSKPIASLRSSIVAGYPTIYNVSVDDKYVRKGIGKMCVQMAQEVYAQNGFNSIHANAYGSKGAKYLSSGMKRAGAFGKWISEKFNPHKGVSNIKAYLNFLKSCDFHVEDVVYSYPCKILYKAKPNEITPDNDNLVIDPEILEKGVLPVDVVEAMSEITVPTHTTDIVLEDRLLTDNIASLAVPLDENNNPITDPRLQIGGISIPYSQIEDLASRIYTKRTKGR